jgi:hypothetical protein
MNGAEGTGPSRQVRAEVSRVARKKPAARRKRRTREHVLADLSANHVERHALLCGYSVERISGDYGIDLRIYTYDQSGEVENGEIQVQLKATDNLKTVANGQAVAVRVERADLCFWLEELMPVILVVYDAAAEVGYWLYVQAHFQGRRGFDPARGPAHVTVRIPKNQVVDQAAMRHFAECRNQVLGQVRGQLIHHE